MDHKERTLSLGTGGRGATIYVDDEEVFIASWNEYPGDETFHTYEHAAVEKFVAFCREVVAAWDGS